MAISNKINKSITKAMRKIRKHKTGCTSGYKELPEPKHSKLTGVKKFLAAKLKRLKSRRQYENPFKHVKYADEKLVNVIYTVKVHDHIYQTKSNQQTQRHANWRDSPHVEVASGIKTSGSGSETPSLCVMTPGCQDIRSDKRRSSRCRQTDDDDRKRQRAHSCSARIGRNENSHMKQVYNTQNQGDGRESAIKRRRSSIFCCQ